MFIRDVAIELADSFRIAMSVLRAHKMRSALTALGVIIGIIAVASALVTWLQLWSRGRF